MEYKELINSGADEYFRQLIDTNWVDEWHDDDIDALHEALQETDAEYMVYCLSEYTFDPEGVSTAEKYKDLFLDLFDKFGIDIEADDIETTQDGEDITITVTTEEGEAQWNFVQPDAWAHDDLFDFLNDEVLPLVGEEKIIYPLPPSSATLELVFALPEMIDDAIEAGVIPEDDYFLE
jgi:hypothetical protein